MLVCLGECDQVPQMGQLEQYSLKAGRLGGSISSFGCPGPTVVEQSPVGRSQGQRRDAWHPQQGRPSQESEGCKRLRILYEEVDESGGSHPCLPALEEETVRAPGRGEGLG